MKNLRLSATNAHVAVWLVKRERRESKKGADMTKYKNFTALYRNVQLPSNRKNTIASKDQDGVIKELFQFIGKYDKFVFETYDRTLLTRMKKCQHVCKGAKAAHEIVSVNLGRALQLVNHDMVDFVDTRIRDVIITTSARSYRNGEIEKCLKYNIHWFLSVILTQSLAKRAAYRNVNKVKYTTRYQDEVDEMFLKGVNKTGTGRVREE